MIYFYVNECCDKRKEESPIYSANVLCTCIDILKILVKLWDFSFSITSGFTFQEMLNLLTQQ